MSHRSHRDRGLWGRGITPAWHHLRIHEPCAEPRPLQTQVDVSFGAFRKRVLETFCWNGDGSNGGQHRTAPNHGLRAECPLAAGAYLLLRQQKYHGLTEVFHSQRDAGSSRAQPSQDRFTVPSQRRASCHQSLLHH